MSTAVTALPVISQDAVSAILDLHRHTDAYIVTAQYEDDGQGEERLRHHLAFTPDQLANMLPSVSRHLLRDGAVSVNACAAPRWARIPSKRRPNVLNPPPYFSAVRYGRSAYNGSNLRRLCACQVDVDGYKMHLSQEETVARVQALCEEGKIPAPSRYAFTGRGVWFLWHLHEKQYPDRAHLGGFPDTMLRLVGANRELAKRLAHLGADQAATGGTLFLSAPRTVRRTTGAQVQWFTFPGKPAYTLGNLCRVLGVKEDRSKREQQTINQVDRSKWGGGPEYTERGHKKSATNRLAAFLCICTRRGGFRKGGRGAAAFVLAKALFGKRVPKDEALAELRRFAEQDCKPPLAAGRYRSILRAAYASERYRHLSYATMANILAVSPAEASLVSSIIHSPFPAAGATIPAPLTKREKIARREDLIRRLHSSWGLMTVSEWEALLTENGVKQSRGTTHADLKRLTIPLKESAAERDNRRGKNTARNVTRPVTETFQFARPA